MPVLDVVDVHYGYSDELVLSGLNLQVYKGEMLGVVGPNGAGKTTLMKIISGVIKPSKGQIIINGHDIDVLTDSERAKLVATVPQIVEFPTGFSAMDMVLMGRNPHLTLFQWPGRIDLNIAKNAMEMTGVWRLADRDMSSLSGGERQRTVIAMAITQETNLMLLDEPSSNLDLSHQILIMDLIRNLQKRNAGATLITMHDLTLAALYCDRIIMLEGGKPYVVGRPLDVLNRENISNVYGTDVIVTIHPKSGTPVVLPIPKSKKP